MTGAGVRAVRPLPAPPDATVAVPGSKSITNRALVCASLAEGVSMLRGAGASDDTDAMVQCVQALGAAVDEGPPGELRVTGTGGRLRAGPVELTAGLAGTTSRFVTALAALGHGRYRVDGAAPLRARPMGPLHDALVGLGVEVLPEGRPGHLPVVIAAAGLPGGAVAMPGDVSSQFVTALMLVAPLSRHGIEIVLTSPLVSRPYVGITTSVMAAFGAGGIAVTDDRITVRPGRYRSCDYRVEPDASSASYLWAAAAVTGGRVTVEGFGTPPLQGDVRVVDILASMGARVERRAGAIRVEGTGELQGVEVDMRDCSDTVPTVATVAAFARGPTRITGVGFIRGKETDRIGALVTELRRCGVDAEEQPDGLVVQPDRAPHRARVRTYDDHRMAMAFAVMGLRTDGIEIEDPGVVSKSFPGFWTALASLEGPRR